MKRMAAIVAIFLVSVLNGIAERMVHDVNVLTEIEELVDPSRCAVLVIDMQNGWVSQQGMCIREDRSVEPNPEKHRLTEQFKDQVENIAQLTRVARETEVPVVTIEYVHENDLGRSLMMGPDWWVWRNAEWVPKVVEGTWDSKTVEDLAPEEGELVIQKSHANSFYDTLLEDQLKDRGIESVLLTGTATAGCVLMTACGAQERGLYPVIVLDCVDHNSKPGLELVQQLFPTFTSQEIVDVWKKPGQSDMTDTAGQKVEWEVSGEETLFELDVNNPSPDTLPSLTVRRQKGIEFCVSIPISFPNVPGLGAESWCYEGEMVSFHSARAFEGNRLEIRHYYQEHPNVILVTTVTPEPGAVEFKGHIELAGETDADIDKTWIPSMCTQVMKSENFRSAPPEQSRAVPEHAENYYKNFVSRCFIFTEDGMTFLDKTQRTTTAADHGFSEDDPRNNPPAVQRYYGVWDRVPEGEGTSSLTRYNLPIMGVVSRDDKYLIVEVSDTARFFSQAWLDCFHSFPIWSPEDVPFTQRTWTRKLYAMENDPDALVERIEKDFPGIENLQENPVPLH